MTLTWERQDRKSCRIAVLVECRTFAKTGPQGGVFLSGHKIPLLVALTCETGCRYYAPDGAEISADAAERRWPDNIAQL